MYYLSGPVKRGILVPIAVDSSQRLDDIAAATLAIASESGPSAVTVRAVAAKLGGSTTLVTNYVASRSELLANAIRYVQAQWRAEQTALADGFPDPVERLRALVTWFTSTEPDDPAARRIWLSAVARVGDESDAARALRADAADQRVDVGSLLRDAGVDDEAGADVVYLALRGFYFATTEDPEEWPPERANAALMRLTDLLLSARALR
jgi:AcrR family transcriptional regulator